MKRYLSTSTYNRWDGKRVYTTTEYPTIHPSSTDTLIISNEGDYLDTLAFTFYGDPTLWFIIALANPGIGKGKLSVPPGLQIRIPKDINDIINRFNNLNQK